MFEPAVGPLFGTVCGDVYRREGDSGREDDTRRRFRGEGRETTIEIEFEIKFWPRGQPPLVPTPKQFIRPAGERWYQRPSIAFPILLLEFR